VNTIRVCELAAVLVACTHEREQTVPVVDGGFRWCMRCGALRSGTDGKWLTSLLAEDIARHLLDDPTGPAAVDPKQLPLPLGMRRRRRGKRA
jgi:hypothetical protein